MLFYMRLNLKRPRLSFSLSLSNPHSFFYDLWITVTFEFLWNLNMLGGLEGLG